jgi:hypothetical protein
MSNKNVVRLEAQLRLVKMVVRGVGGAKFVATALSRSEVASVLGCTSGEVDRHVQLWDLRPRRSGDSLRFPVSQVRDLIAKRAR